MKKKIKFTILTICLNEQERISLTCNSIKQQLNRDFEWIIIDGGSVDDTLMILEGFRNNNMKILQQETQYQGLYGAMSQGLDNASGEYVIFLNGGDILYSENTLNNVATLIESSFSDVYYGNSIYDKSDRLPLLPWGFSKYLMIVSLFLGRNFSHQAVVYRRESIKDFRFESTYKIIEDAHFHLRLLKSGLRFGAMSRVLSVVDGNGLSSTNVNQLKDEFEILLKRELNFLEKLGVFLLRKLQKITRKK